MILIEGDAWILRLFWQLGSDREIVEAHAARLAFRWVEEASHKARDLVRERWPSIVVIAAALVTERRLSGRGHNLPNHSTTRFFAAARMAAIWSAFERSDEWSVSDRAAKLIECK